MSDFANAINAEANRAIEELRDYGRLLAQSGVGLMADELTRSSYDMKHIRQGYKEQLRDYPNG